MRSEILSNYAFLLQIYNFSMSLGVSFIRIKWYKFWVKAKQYLSCIFKDFLQLPMIEEYVWKENSEIKQNFK